MVQKKESFENSLQRLEEEVERLENGDLSLEEALQSFEKGVQCACRCREALKAMETRVELLIKRADGEMAVEDFDRD